MSHEATERSVQIVNRAGFHARPAAMFVSLASRYDCEVTVEKDGMEVNGKSILNVMMLAAEQGSRITIRARGSDACNAVDSLADLVESGFDEDEEEQ